MLIQQDARQTDLHNQLVDFQLVCIQQAASNDREATTANGNLLPPPRGINTFHGMELVDNRSTFEPLGCVVKGW
eukprot:557687-Amphidinium_carterae.1